MNNLEEYILTESTNNYHSYSIDDEYIEQQDSLVFAVKKSQRITIVQGEINEFTESIFHIIQENNEKEVFYLKAINNLLKQKEYLNLLYQVSNNLISDEEFNSELEENENRYLINIDNDLNSKNYSLILKIIDKIDANFTDDDVSEIFSLRTHSIENILLNNDKMKDEGSF